MLSINTCKYTLQQPRTLHGLREHRAVDTSFLAYRAVETAYTFDAGGAFLIPQGAHLQTSDNLNVPCNFYHSTCRIVNSSPYTVSADMSSLPSPARSLLVARHDSSCAPDMQRQQPWESQPRSKRPQEKADQPYKPGTLGKASDQD